MKERKNTDIDFIVSEKVTQALDLMKMFNFDVWLIVAQETGYEHDPVYPLIFGERDLGKGFLILTKSGRKIAVVSGLDRTIPESTGVWDEVFVYGKKPYDTLCEVLQEIKPGTIAVNYSETDASADGLTYGKYLQLTKTFSEHGISSNIVSAEKPAALLRSVKSFHEVEAVRSAILKANEVFDRLRLYLKSGMTGKEIFGFVQEQIMSLGLGYGWSRYNCPVVTVGPVEYMGHTSPDERRIEKGQLLQLDLGVKYNGYCSDFQRMFYFMDDSDNYPPEDVKKLFGLVRSGIDKMIASIKPGARNDYPSSIGFNLITSAGYPEPKYSAGHQLGRAVHDGGTGLLHFRNPNEDCIITQGQIYTVEGLETRLEGRGWVSLEEDVIVTADGCRILTDEQREIWLVRGK